ncbi:hypothetical protein PflCFBP13517_18370 [Pseudomonas fluorescens]|nr:hypothetical protein PflCFBP13517_18370 [Pseudomonas fluorescens]
MAAPKTVLTYPLNGAQKDFTIPFEYLARKFIVVALIGKTRQTLTLNSDYRFTSRTTITTTKAWGPGDLFTDIEIRRVTSATERLVDFADGSILRAYDLNTSQVQSLHIAEEARDLTADTIAVNNDGDLDARGRRIVNVADAVLDGDAINLRQEKAWAQSALNQANRSQSEADRSTVEADRAAVNNSQSYTNNVQSWGNATTATQKAAEALQWANESSRHAGNSATSAAASQTSNEQAYGNVVEARKSAAASENSAVRSFQDANRSTAEADRAKDEANKLGNANALMEVIEVSGIGQGGTRYKPDLSFVVQGTGEIYKNTPSGLLKYFNQSDFDPSKKKDVALGTTGNMNMMFWQGDANQGSTYGVYTGNLELREKNLVSTSGNGDQAYGPSITFHYGGFSVKQLFMDSTSVLRWGNQYVGAQPKLQLVDSNGRLGLDDGASYLDFNGNIKSSLYEAGTLYDELVVHRKYRDQIRAEKHYPLWSGSFAQGGTITLNTPATGFEYFFYDNIDGIYNTGIFLPAIGAGKRFYLQCAGGGWYTLRWNDANYTSLTMVDAGGSAKIITAIYGVAHNGANLGR